MNYSSPAVFAHAPAVRTAPKFAKEQLLEIVTLRERMTQAFWVCLFFNLILLLFKGHVDGVILLLGAVVEIIYVAYGFRLVKACGGSPWQKWLSVLLLLLPILSVVELIFLRSWSMQVLTDHGVSKAKPWQMRNQIRRA